MLDYIRAVLGSDDSQFIIFGIVVSAMGGMANWLLSDQHTFFRFFAAVFLAGFAGFLVGQLCLAADIEGGWAFFICGSAGLSGEVILKLSRKYVIKKFSFMTGQVYHEQEEPYKEKGEEKQEAPQEKSDETIASEDANRREKFIFKKALERVNNLGLFMDDNDDKKDKDEK